MNLRRRKYIAWEERSFTVYHYHLSNIPLCPDHWQITLLASVFRQKRNEKNNNKKKKKCVFILFCISDLEQSIKMVNQKLFQDMQHIFLNVLLTTFYSGRGERVRPPPD